MPPVMRSLRKPFAKEATNVGDFGGVLIFAPDCNKVEAVGSQVKSQFGRDSLPDRSRVRDAVLPLAAIRHPQHWVRFAIRPEPASLCHLMLFASPALLTLHAWDPFLLRPQTQADQQMT
jgi:hypothetical protein